MSRNFGASPAAFEAGTADIITRPIPAPAYPASRRRLQQALAELGPAHPLPPPPRPVRTAPPVELPTPPLATEQDAIGPPTSALIDSEIVSALADAAAGHDAHSADHLSAAAVHVPAERPPMIIERALAEQAAGLVPGALPRLRAWPGLLTGFVLALMVGVGLYLAVSVA
jgi:hypothetical protein